MSADACTNCGHAKVSHFSCEVGSFCKECPTEDNRWEHVFKESTALGSLTQIEDALLELWTNYRAKPDIMAMRLRNLRAIGWNDPEVIAWLTENQNVSDDALVVLGLGGSIAIYAPEQADEIMSILLLHKKPDGDGH